MKLYQNQLDIIRSAADHLDTRTADEVAQIIRNSVVAGPMLQDPTKAAEHLRKAANEDVTGPRFSA